MRKTVFALLLSLGLFAAGRGEVAAFGQNKILYDDFDWKVYRSTHFEIYYYSREEKDLQRVANFAESAYDQLSRDFNYQIAKPIPLIFYRTHAEFEQNNIILNFIPEGVGAFAEPARNRMVLPIDLPDDRLQELIAHELTHIFEYEILFQGKLRKALTTRPPQWFMEGLASYMGKDEDSRDQMILRDAVVHDQIPPIAQGGVSGFFAYRFGHAAFDFIESKWGKEGVRDFVYEFRNTIGAGVEKALERAFQIEPEEFDLRFRKFLRSKYLKTLVEKGEPDDFGQRLKVDEGAATEISPAVSPSGDLTAALSTYREDVDVVVIGNKDRKLIRNLSRGYSRKYETIAAQFVSVAPEMGKDLAWSPDGDTLAFFARRGRGRRLFVINAISGAIEESVAMDVDQQLAPSFSPDGRRIAFQGNRDGVFDIFIYDLDTRQVENFTADPLYDGAPVFSPDGKWLIYSSVSEKYAKLFRASLANRGEKYQLTSGETNDIDAAFSPDGTRVFFSSDRDGIYNIYSLELATGNLLKYTDVIGGCFTPAVFIGTDNVEKLVFSAYHKRRSDIYIADTAKNLGNAGTAIVPSAPITNEELGRFKPAIELAIDDSAKKKYPKWKFFIDDANISAGVNSDQTFQSRSEISFSDFVGNKRLIASFDSVSSFSNFDFLYLDLSHRLQWAARIFDSRTYYLDVDENRDGEVSRIRRQVRTTGGMGLLLYPFDKFHRSELGIGYLSRELDLPLLVRVPGGGTRVEFVEVKDEYPFAQLSFVGDNSRFKSFGPVAGRRYDLTYSYAPDLDDGGALYRVAALDFRAYLPIAARTVLAWRVSAGIADGNRPAPFYFGGLDTLRGFEFREIIGNRMAFSNLEFRFPLVDYVRTPIFQFQDVRGRLFFDIGGAYFKGQDFEFWNSSERRLQNALASYGMGFSIELAGLQLHWDFARLTDLRDSTNKFHSSFWIGRSF